MKVIKSEEVNIYRKTIRSNHWKQSDIEEITDDEIKQISEFSLKILITEKVYGMYILWKNCNECHSCLTSRSYNTAYNLLCDLDEITF